MNDSTSLLRNVLGANAAFSFASGIVFALAGAALDTWTGVNQWILIGLGVGLVGYAAVIWFGANKPATLTQTGQLAIAGDVAWIVIAIALVLFTSWLTTKANVALVLLSVPVALFAWGQTRGLKKLS